MMFVLLFIFSAKALHRSCRHWECEGPKEVKAPASPIIVVIFLSCCEKYWALVILLEAGDFERKRKEVLIL